MTTTTPPPSVEHSGVEEPSTSDEAEPTLQPSGAMLVGLGASAGGLESLSTFLQHMPADSGLAFVIVTHQPSGRVSGLADLLRRQTAMPVLDVEEATRIRPNHVYVAPPGRYLTVHGDRLLPSEEDRRRLTMPIDSFFQSLAQARQERAAAIVLSGTGTDGTRGLKHIRAQLGVTMVQEESSARFAGMPHSAIFGDSPDFVLPIEDMPKELIAYASQLEEGKAARARDVSPERAAGELHAVLALLRERSGHDFATYKETTVRRRIERRMNVYQINAVSKYLQYLKRDPDELDRLFEELLIGVTAFFRDADAFERLRGALIELLRKVDPSQAVRVWVAGCSTGEEAYSIAILLKEAMQSIGRTHPLQIFATDLDPKAIEFARQGVYHVSAAADLGAERVTRFFVREHDSLRVRKELRDCIVFAVQNVAEDPPLTRVDLISCRNLLIYFGVALQKRLVPLFHHALRGEGLLLLGSSEGIGSFSNLFDAVDKQAKLFRRHDVAWKTFAADVSHQFGVEPRKSESAQLHARRADPPTGQVTEKLLLRELLPPTVMIRENGTIVHIHGRTGQFLEPAPGPQVASNLFHMAREGLPLELTAAVRQAARDDAEVVRVGVPFLDRGSSMLLDLKLRRLTEPESLRGLIAVSFERVRARETPVHEAGAEPATALIGAASHVLDLERQLLFTKESLQSTIEELEVANDELTSTNEELQSTNEELQSTNEELETSKEELQSLNEELQTVNAELQGKVDELSQANDDMTNLLNATDIATLFLDNDLNIKRHTQQTKKIIRLIPSDVGRPIADLVSSLRYDTLVDDAHAVLRTLSSKEAEVQAVDGRWYLMRIMPYRTTDHVIDGLVLTFVDISRVKELQQSEERLVATIHESPVRVFGMDRALRFVWTCSGLFGLSSEQLLGKTAGDILGAENAQPFVELQQRALSAQSALRELVTLQVRGELRTYDLHVRPQLAQEGVVGASSVMMDVTDQTPA